MTVLSAQRLARSYGTRVVLDDVSLTLARGDRVGLVGGNGSGKSTLARILAGIEEPDRGERILRRGVEVGYLPQEPRFEGDPTALEAALGGLHRWRAAVAEHTRVSEAMSAPGADLKALVEAQQQAAAAVERLGGWNREAEAEAMLGRVHAPAPDRRVSTMSGGERRRVDLARVLVSRPEVLILDEPTNHLDVDTIEWLEAHLAREQPGALLVITHDRYFLDRVVDRTAELSRGTLRVYDGGYRAYLEAKAEREAHEARVEHNRQRFVKQELDWLRRSPKARTTKQKARIQRAQEAIAERAPTRERTVSLEAETLRSGRTIVELDELRLEIGGRTLVRDLTLSLTEGERVGIVGPNGAGKTSLLRAVLGELLPASGRVVRGAKTRITYVGQHREGLDERASVLDNVTGGRALLEFGGRTVHAHSYLERFLFDGAQQRQPVGALSGGEKARVLLAKLLLQPTNLLVLDEPTNDLDVMTLAALEELVVEMGVATLVVTHDRFFLDRIATSILAFEGEGRVVRYAGDYTAYRRQRPPAAPQAAAPKQPKPKPASPRPPRRGLSGKEKRELASLMETIEALEGELAELEARLADPRTYAGGGSEAAELARALDERRTALDAKLERWEVLEAKASGTD